MYNDLYHPRRARKSRRTAGWHTCTPECDRPPATRPQLSNSTGSMGLVMRKHIAARKRGSMVARTEVPPPPLRKTFTRLCKRRTLMQTVALLWRGSRPTRRGGTIPRTGGPAARGAHRGEPRGLPPVVRRPPARRAPQAAQRDAGCSPSPPPPPPPSTIRILLHGCYCKHEDSSWSCVGASRPAW
jgi:hypothetical protein